MTKSVIPGTARVYYHGYSMYTGRHVHPGYTYLGTQRGIYREGYLPTIQQGGIYREGGRHIPGGVPSPTVKRVLRRHMGGPSSSPTVKRVKEAGRPSSSLSGIPGWDTFNHF